MNCTILWNILLFVFFTLVLILTPIFSNVQQRFWVCLVGFRNSWRNSYTHTCNKIFFCNYFINQQISKIRESYLKSMYLYFNINFIKLKKSNLFRLNIIYNNLQIIKVWQHNHMICVFSSYYKTIFEVLQFVISWIN